MGAFLILTLFTLYTITRIYLYTLLGILMRNIV